MKKYRNGGPTGKRIPGAAYKSARGYVPHPGDISYSNGYYPDNHERFYTTDQEYIDLRFMPGPDQNPNRPVWSRASIPNVVKFDDRPYIYDKANIVLTDGRTNVSELPQYRLPGEIRSTTQVPVNTVKGKFENGGLMNTDKLKQMYSGGGMMKYRDGGPVGPEATVKAKQRRYSRTLVPSVEEVQFKEELGNYADEYLRGMTSKGMGLEEAGMPIEERKTIIEGVMSGDYSHPMARDAYRYAMDKARQQGILQERFIDRDTQEYVTPDMMEEVSSRGMRFMPEAPGSYTYIIGR